MFRSQSNDHQGTSYARVCTSLNVVYCLFSYAWGLFFCTLFHNTVHCFNDVLGFFFAALLWWELLSFSAILL
jgi:hypothetical protein